MQMWKKILLFILAMTGITMVIIAYLYSTSILSLNFNDVKTQDFEKIKYNSVQSKENFVQAESYNLWSLSIPKINLENIEIHESVDDEVLEKYIGHFSFSSYLCGNVCLAAHNAGFSNNYFEKLNLLEIDDEIIYSYNEKTKKYRVSAKGVVSQYDISIIEDNGFDEITLITCVAGSPDLRLYVKAISEE